MIRIDEVLTEEINKRCSRRRYSEKPITVQEEVEILKIIEKINDDSGLESVSYTHLTLPTNSRV